MIAFITRIWIRFLRWWGLLPKAIPSISEPQAPIEPLPERPRFSAFPIADVPESPESDKIYIVGENGHNWAIVMLCPCGCQAMIQLNMLKPARPRWDFSMDKIGRISVSPSIWRNKGCRSHFFIRNGDVAWASDAESETHLPASKD